jgi:hypothetical protein
MGAYVLPGHLNSSYSLGAISPQLVQNLIEPVRCGLAEKVFTLKAAIDKLQVTPIGISFFVQRTSILQALHLFVYTTSGLG